MPEKIEVVFKYSHQSVKVRRDTVRMIANDREQREYLVISHGYDDYAFTDDVYVPVESVPVFLATCRMLAEGDLQ